MIRKKPLDAVQLRLLALALMLVDHIGAVFFPEALWLRAVGRLSFPIFAFQTAEGFRHTANLRRYALRLALFALISEVPFDLVFFGSPCDLSHQNVLFTLLLGLLGLHFTGRFGLLAPFLAALLGELTGVDYGAIGVFTVVAFGLLDGHPLPQLAVMLLLHGVLQGEPRLWGWIPLQSFAVLAVGLCWLYNGKKGARSRLLQLGFYGFYPVHLLVLWLFQNLTL